MAPLAQDPATKALSRADSRELVELIQIHSPTVRRRVAPLIPDRHRAMVSVDDVMQQAYVDAFEDFDRFEARGENSFVAWLTTLAKNNLNDAIRMLDADKRGGNHRRVRHRPREESCMDLLDSLGITMTTPSQDAARKETLSALERAIEKLPPIYRQVVEMYDLQEHPVRGVAVAVQRSPGAVFMIRTRAHRKLRGIMGSTSMYFSTS